MSQSYSCVALLERCVFITRQCLIQLRTVTHRLSCEEMEKDLRGKW